MLCFRFCCCCCKHLSSDGSDKYPHVFYGHLPHQQDMKQPLIEDEDETQSVSSVGRRYKYPQKYREYAVPPQLTEADEDFDLVVRDQPRASAAPGGHDSRNHRPHQSPQASHSEESYNSEDDDDDMGYTSTGRNPSIVQIQRSPDHTLKRGQHIEFPKDKKMSLNTLRPLNPSLLRKLDELKPEASPCIAGVHFSLYFDEVKSMFIVHVTRAVNLPTQRPAQTSNPFVQVYLLPGKTDVQQSHCVDGTHSPVFDRVFRFINLTFDSLRRQQLVMRFYINVNHFVGGVLCPLEDANTTGENTVQDIEAFDEDMGLQVCCRKAKTHVCGCCTRDSYSIPATPKWSKCTVS